MRTIIGEQLLYADDAPGSIFPINLYNEGQRGETGREKGRESERDATMMICKVRTNGEDKGWDAGIVKTLANVRDPPTILKDASSSSINLN